VVDRLQSVMHARVQQDWQRDIEGSADGAADNMHGPYACTTLLARRLYPEARSFRLGSLAAFHDLPSSGRGHRAGAVFSGNGGVQHEQVLRGSRSRANP
jgi:hypothetical protein